MTAEYVWSPSSAGFYPLIEKERLKAAGDGRRTVLMYRRKNMQRYSRLHRANTLEMWMGVQDGLTCPSHS